MSFLGLLAMCAVSFILISFSFILIAQNLFTVPFVPSSRRKLRKVFAQLGFNENTKFIDLGSGTGTAVFAAANAGAGYAEGVEINPYLIAISNFIKLFSAKKEHVHFKLGSYYKVNIPEYNVVYVYLFPAIIHKMEDELFANIPPGGMLISNSFKFAKHEPSEILEKRFYIYRK